MRGMLVFGMLALAACDGTEGLVLASGDGGADLAGADLATTGCPSDPALAENTSCGEEGKSCGTCGDNPCEFCNLLRCSSGKWTSFEGFPDPSCTQPCHLSSTEITCSSIGGNVCGPKGAFCNADTMRCECEPKVCSFGQDQTCNDNPAASTIYGKCNQFGACECGAEAEWNSQTGKCRPACPASAPPSGSGCANAGLACSYLPNTTCTCVPENVWACAF